MEHFIRTRFKNRRILKEVQIEENAIFISNLFRNIQESFTATQECEILDFCSVSTISCSVSTESPTSFIDVDVDIDTHTLYIHAFISHSLIFNQRYFSLSTCSNSSAYFEFYYYSAVLTIKKMKLNRFLI